MCGRVASPLLGRRSRGSLPRLPSASGAPPKCPPNRYRESEPGTFETCRPALKTSACWARPEVIAHRQNDEIDPKPTSALAAGAVGLGTVGDAVQSAFQRGAAENADE